MTVGGLDAGRGRRAGAAVGPPGRVGPAGPTRALRQGPGPPDPHAPTPGPASRPRSSRLTRGSAKERASTGKRATVGSTPCGGTSPTGRRSPASEDQRQGPAAGGGPRGPDHRPVPDRYPGGAGVLAPPPSDPGAPVDGRPGRRPEPARGAVRTSGRSSTREWARLAKPSASSGRRSGAAAAGRQFGVLPGHAGRVPDGARLGHDRAGLVPLGLARGAGPAGGAARGRPPGRPGPAAPAGCRCPRPGPGRPVCPVRPRCRRRRGCRRGPGRSSRSSVRTR